MKINFQLLTYLTVSLAIVILFLYVGSASAFPPGYPMMTETNVDSIPHTPLPKVDTVWLAILRNSSDTLPTMKMIPGKAYPMTDDGLMIRVTDFYNHWMIKGKPVNYSKEEKNPAIRVEILRGDSLLYARWAFKNLPFFGMNKMLGHVDSTEIQFHFTLLKYEGMQWEEK